MFTATKTANPIACKQQMISPREMPWFFPSSNSVYPAGGTRRVVNGAINLVDLANLDSCCFIATEDMGRLHEDGGFEVLGRIDNSDIRGCSLMTI